MNVLILEDDALIALALEATLKEMDYNPVLALTMDEALDCLETRAIDAAILDLDIHGRLCRPVAEALQNAAIPFFYVSGLSQDRALADMPDAQFLQKPAQDDDLLRALHRLADRQVERNRH